MKIIKTWTFEFNPALYPNGDLPQGIDCDINEFIEERMTPHSDDEIGSKYTYEYSKGFEVIDIKYSTSPCKYFNYSGVEHDGVIESALLIYKVDLDQ